MSSRSSKPSVAKPRAAVRKKTTRIEARLTNAQKSLLQQAAELRGQSLTEFVIRAGEDAAARVLEQEGVAVLTVRESARFVDALMTPPAPAQRLIDAARRYRTRPVVR